MDQANHIQQMHPRLLFLSVMALTCTGKVAWQVQTSLMCHFPRKGVRGGVRGLLGCGYNSIAVFYLSQQTIPQPRQQNVRCA